VALGTVQFSTQAGGVEDATMEALQRAMDPAKAAGVQVEYSGGVYPGSKISVPEQPEIIGVVVAFIILLITFGAVVAAGLPILTACIGVGVGVLGILGVAAWTDIPSAALSLALMLGLCCGIDYALFILTRHRNNLLLMSTVESAALAVGTAGSSVVFAALTVIIALCALSLVGIPFLTAMGLAAAAAVFIAMLIALTLLPALLSLAGTEVAKFMTTPLRPGYAKEVAQIAAYTPHRTFGASWARFFVRFRIPLVLAGTAALIVLGLPAPTYSLDCPAGQRNRSPTPHVRLIGESRQPLRGEYLSGRTGTPKFSESATRLYEHVGQRLGKHRSTAPLAAHNGSGRAELQAHNAF